MRLIAEERQTGTISLLYSSPVHDLEIVLGKFLAALGFLCVFLAATLYMPALVAAYGKVSLGHVFAGYLGLFAGGLGRPRHRHLRQRADQEPGGGGGAVGRDGAGADDVAGSSAR